MIGIVARPYSAWCRLEEVIPSLVELILILVIRERISVALERAYKSQQCGPVLPLVSSLKPTGCGIGLRDEHMGQRLRKIALQARNWSIPDGSRCH
jgi:hypothetical protein